MGKGIAIEPNIPARIALSRLIQAHKQDLVKIEGNIVLTGRPPIESVSDHINEVLNKSSMQIGKKVTLGSLSRNSAEGSATEQWGENNNEEPIVPLYRGSLNNLVEQRSIVEAITLDDYILNRISSIGKKKSIGILKLHCQGCEMDALHGSKMLLKEGKICTIFARVSMGWKLLRSRYGPAAFNSSIDFYTWQVNQLRSIFSSGGRTDKDDGNINGYKYDAWIIMVDRPERTLWDMASVSDEIENHFVKMPLSVTDYNIISTMISKIASYLDDESLTLVASRNLEQQDSKHTTSSNPSTTDCDKISVQIRKLIKGIKELK